VAKPIITRSYPEQMVSGISLTHCRMQCHAHERDSASNAVLLPLLLPSIAAAIAAAIAAISLCSRV
jgi:hypothetical protein